MCDEQEGEGGVWAYPELWPSRGLSRSKPTITRSRAQALGPRVHLLSGAAFPTRHLPCTSSESHQFTHLAQIKPVATANTTRPISNMRPPEESNCKIKRLFHYVARERQDTPHPQLQDHRVGRRLLPVRVDLLPDPRSSLIPPLQDRPAEQRAITAIELSLRGHRHGFCDERVQQRQL